MRFSCVSFALFRGKVWNLDKIRLFSAFSFSGKSAILVDRKRYHRAVSLAKEQEYHNETENQKEIRPPAPAVRTHRLYGSVRQQPCDLSCHRRERDPAERLRAVLRCDAGGPAHRRTIQHRRLFVPIWNRPSALPMPLVQQEIRPSSLYDAALAALSRKAGVICRPSCPPGGSFPDKLPQPVPAGCLQSGSTPYL